MPAEREREKERKGEREREETGQREKERERARVSERTNLVHTYSDSNFAVDSRSVKHRDDGGGDPARH